MVARYVNDLYRNRERAQPARFLPRIAFTQQPLQGLPRLGRVIVPYYLVLNDFQDQLPGSPNASDFDWRKNCGFREWLIRCRLRGPRSGY
jgi:hypothetical protein